MDWFDTERRLSEWGGPDFRYPFDQASFIADAGLDKVTSLFIQHQQALVAFGQYYDRAGFCHLARLAVAPKCRGQGLIALRIEQLETHAGQNMDFDGLSLFVLDDNPSAIAAYQKLGFGFKPSPQADLYPNILYMQRRKH